MVHQRLGTSAEAASVNDAGKQLGFLVERDCRSELSVPSMLITDCLACRNPLSAHACVNSSNHCCLRMVWYTARAEHSGKVQEKDYGCVLAAAPHALTALCPKHRVWAKQCLLHACCML